jgi:gliding motility-associated protein GldE
MIFTLVVFLPLGLPAFFVLFVFLLCIAYLLAALVSAHRSHFYPPALLSGSNQHVGFLLSVFYWAFLWGAVVLGSYLYIQLASAAMGWSPWWGVLVLGVGIGADLLARHYGYHYADRLIKATGPTLSNWAAWSERGIKPLQQLLLGSNRLERIAIELAEESTEEERSLLSGLATFGQTQARQAMRPRLEITAFDIEWDFHELMDKINKSGYSRVPVYADTLDDIEGMLYVKDLLPHLHKDEHFRWQSLIRKAYFIPESKHLDDLLREFQTRRVHIAVVVDEYGGTSGLITLEDVIEEIFGDIHDEYDEFEELGITQIDEKNYLVEGKMPLNDFLKALDLPGDYFDEVRSKSESLGGILLELFSRLPRAGEHISFRGLSFKIHSADKKRIKKIRLTVL